MQTPRHVDTTPSRGRAGGNFASQVEGVLANSSSFLKHFNTKIAPWWGRGGMTEPLTPPPLIYFPANVEGIQIIFELKMTHMHTAVLKPFSLGKRWRL